MKTIYLFILFLTIVSATLFASAESRHFFIEDDPANIKATGICKDILKGNLVACVKVKNSALKACKCDISDISSDNYQEEKQCNVTPTNGVKEQARGACLILGGEPQNCGLVNAENGYWSCQCKICN